MQNTVTNLGIITFVLIFSIYFIEVICLRDHSLEFIFERIEVDYIKEEYIKNWTVNVRRFSRKDPHYVLNIEGDIQHQWSNNVSVSLIFYEYLHNEYKRSFVELHIKLCDWINEDDFIGQVLRLYGVECPLKKGHFNVSNWRAKFPKFPYLFPFKKTKCDALLYVTDTKVTMARGYLYMYLKQI